MIKITSVQNQILKNIKKLISSAKERFEQGRFAVEGLRLCRDAVDSDADIFLCVVSDKFCTANEDFIRSLERKSIDVYLISDSLFVSIADTKAPQGILLVVKTLDNQFQFDKIKGKAKGKFILLEDIQDPANLGTILRSAEAFAFDAAFLTKDCCDIYNSKVLRGSMGAIFRQQTAVIDDACGFISEFNSLGKSYAAVLTENSDELSQIVFSGNSLLVIGNEGSGLKRDTVAACSKSLHIPMCGSAESLNAAVAASILMYKVQIDLS